jgi:hypothetical protein
VGLLWENMMILDSRGYQTICTKSLRQDGVLFDVAAIIESHESSISRSCTVSSYEIYHIFPSGRREETTQY